MKWACTLDEKILHKYWKLYIIIALCGETIVQDEATKMKYLFY